MRGENVHLRAMEPEDLSLLYSWENDTDNWTVSNTTAPFSRHTLQRFIETSSQSFFTNQQIRLMVVENKHSQTVGCVDVFEYDPKHSRAGVGILIAEEYRQKGYGLESLRLILKYLFQQIGVHQVFCHIMENNHHSISIFQKAGFQLCGRKREWIRTSDGWVDELTFQCFSEQKSLSSTTNPKNQHYASKLG